MTLEPGPAVRAASEHPSAAEQQPAASVSFCGHCGERDEEPPARARVCGRCGLGLMLAASRALAPEPEEAFVVLDAGLTVCAVSQIAERLLGVTERFAVNRHITELLLPAEAEGSEGVLAAAVSRAAHGDVTVVRVVVRPVRTFGVRFGARIGPCGPIPAALMVLDRTGKGPDQPDYFAI